MISQRAENLGAEYIVCTPKDRVKLEGWADARLFVMDLELQWSAPLRGDQDFALWLEKEMDRLYARRPQPRDP